MFIYTTPLPRFWPYTDEMMYDIIALELQDSPKRKQQQITDKKTKIHSTTTHYSIVEEAENSSLIPD